MTCPGFEPRPGLSYCLFIPSLGAFAMETKACTSEVDHSALLDNGLGLLSIVGSDRELLA
jgi:hypothetical protein